MYKRFQWSPMIAVWEPILKDDPSIQNSRGESQLEISWRRLKSIGLDIFLILEVINSNIFKHSGHRHNLLWDIILTQHLLIKWFQIMNTTLISWLRTRGEKVKFYKQYSPIWVRSRRRRSMLRSLKLPKITMQDTSNGQIIILMLISNQFKIINK